MAGAALAADIIKCRLKPVTAADYKVAFSVEETKRLKTAFPRGVCDWSKPGVEQQPMTGTWQTFMPTTAGTSATP